MTAQPTENLDKILEQVRNLLARADHPNTPAPEAELSRARAEKMMAKYRIAEATAVAHGEVVMAPEWRTMFICNLDSEFRNHYAGIARAIVEHVGGRSRFHTAYDEALGDYVYRMDVVGYVSDLRFMEVLLSTSMLAFSTRLEPKYHPEESPESNAYRMRLAGMERRRIADILLGTAGTVNEMKAKNRKVTAFIKAGAKEAGADASEVLGRGNSVKTYRTSYADGFWYEFTSRLARMRIQSGLEGNEIVLSNRADNVDEAFYEKFPEYRPAKAAGAVGGATAGWARSECEKCQKAKGGFCRDHSYLKPRAAKDRPFNHLAASKGRQAAREVNLGGKGGGSLGS